MLFDALACNAMSGKTFGLRASHLFIFLTELYQSLEN